jgi:hypothetical protein
MRGGLFWLNDKQWARIEPHRPTGLTGPYRDDDRRILSGIVHMLQSGARKLTGVPPEEKGRLYHLRGPSVPLSASKLGVRHRSRSGKDRPRSIVALLFGRQAIALGLFRQPADLPVSLIWILAH